MRYALGTALSVLGLSLLGVVPLMSLYQLIHIGPMFGINLRPGAPSVAVSFLPGVAFIILGALLVRWSKDWPHLLEAKAAIEVGLSAPKISAVIECAAILVVVATALLVYSNRMPWDFGFAFVRPPELPQYFRYITAAMIMTSTYMLSKLTGGPSRAKACVLSVLAASIYYILWWTPFIRSLVIEFRSPPRFPF